MHGPRIVTREVDPRAAWALEQQGQHPLLARLFAGRGIRDAAALDDTLTQLLPPATMKGTTDAARLLADAIEQGQRLCVVADYDCDGATACAVALRGLALLGAQPAQLRYVVPDRAVHGYGLTPAIVDLAIEQHRPDWLLTVDNGIASLAGVAHAQARGLRVLVTDHHLPAVVDGQPVVPPAEAVVNPNQPGCAFASKALAGVGVMFYVLLALRAERRARGAFDAANQPRLDSLLDLVALGTVADVVRLDDNNRRLVAQGLKRIRRGQMQPGVAALFSAAARRPERASAFDFGFALGPRINAAGRLSDMTLGIECLLTDDPGRADELARQLDAINRERREVESGMREQAELLLEDRMPQGTPPAAMVLFDPGFHEGVVGIVAGRLKDRLHRPTFVFARGQDGALKGSGRSIPGFHLRDALDLVSKREAGLLLRFGGHAMAAGCTLADEAAVARFDAALRAIAAEWLPPDALTRTITTDGPLPLEYFNAETVQRLDAAVWGQGFEAPLFCDQVQVVNQRLVGEKHLKLRVRHGGQLRDAIWFGHAEPVGDTVRLAYRLSLDEFQGQQRVQMVVEAAG
ncbi:single-stranded-DNA-specific exonuclease RecJ [Ideonella sp. 4Y16]|uniref:Single-stranded-DNA-specific exonuclease RecJ n=1 Tax=Ideonella alba TaxID=2824118 RepID=A0A940Y965_9BURK|nr:single-stranded-DNA-specific exonuclease RecJ [Ideonella alba]MBQ0929978.1 single-stranded-DNA-specific exonuclease RecJ [Ideonella alba]MBQ0946008.1 single-stranded-DNA-specific exonuclease RecJ [Ideonella alba]